MISTGKVRKLEGTSKNAETENNNNRGKLRMGLNFISDTKDQDPQPGPSYTSKQLGDHCMLIYH